MSLHRRLDLFCRVADDNGDIGACWRLARQLADEHAVAVTLWVDDLAGFKSVCSAADMQNALQVVQGVLIRRWPAEFPALAADDVADVVIEAFACELPAPYTAAMAEWTRQPAWINLEYLSAETWIEGCHRLAARHETLPLTKYFFFPGFTSKTGGLICEKNLPARRRSFQEETGEAEFFLQGLGVDVPPDAQRVSLNCYPQAPVGALLQAMQAGPQPVLCLVPEGGAQAAVNEFLQSAAVAGAKATRGALTVHVLPFLDQPDYDRLLWSCDLNFVRGEDALVRAQWAARPFVWQASPQREDAHWAKLQAFLGRYAALLPSSAKQATIGAMQAWNGRGDMASAWPLLLESLPYLAEPSATWAGLLQKNGDLAGNLLQFIKEIA